MSTQNIHFEDQIRDPNYNIISASMKKNRNSRGKRAIGVRAIEVSM